MVINFKGKDVIHQELDVHGIASKAELYNAAVPAKVIEDGLNAGLELMYYLAADGYKIKTSLFTLRIRVQGEYDGSETHLYEGAFPTAYLQPSADFRNFIKEVVTDSDDNTWSARLCLPQAVQGRFGSCQYQLYLACTNRH